MVLFPKNLLKKIDQLLTNQKRLQMKVVQSRITAEKIETVFFFFYKQNVIKVFSENDAYKTYVISKREKENR